jgi:hypothetical protein
MKAQDLTSAVGVLLSAVLSRATSFAIMSRHNNPALSRLSGLLLNKARIGLLITIPPLTLSGCIGCEEGSEFSLSALLGESATGSASTSSTTGTSTSTALGTSTSSSQLTTGSTLTTPGLAGTGTLSPTTQEGTLGGCVGEGGVGTDLSIPRALQIFDVTLTGTVGSEDFSASGVLILQPSVPNGGNFDNEFNMRDLGLFSGDPTTDREAGAISFATNTAIHRQSAAQEERGVVAPDVSNLAAADVAFVEADSVTNVLTVRVDPAFAADEEAEEFNAISDPSIAVPLEIVGGTMTLEFAGEGETVTGNVVFAGGGAGQIEVTSYAASITGTRRTQ